MNAVLSLAWTGCAWVQARFDRRDAGRGRAARVRLGVAALLVAAAGMALGTGLGTAYTQIAGAADHTLRIAPLRLELAPGRVIDTFGYNGTVPGPVLRLREGRRDHFLRSAARGSPRKGDGRCQGRGT